MYRLDSGPFHITGTASPRPTERGTNKLMDPFIRLTALTKRFDEVVAVDNLSLDIEKGELFCLLGASGCGKSTLLRMLAGFEQPSAGRIEIDGQNMAGVVPADRPVNIMFQNSKILMVLTYQKYRKILQIMLCGCLIFV